MKLLVVEDNPRLAERIQRHVKKHHAVDIASTGDEALSMVRNHTYEVILLDLNLPDMHGSDICTYLRKNGNDTPILVLTGIDTMAMKVDLLNFGADDYLTKPFNGAELQARIAALGRRRSRLPPRTVLKYKDLVMDIDNRKVSRGDVAIDLRRKEFDILEYLITHQGRILTREMIMNHAWDGTKISWKSTIDVHIKHLRDKVDRPFSFPIIKTAYGLGYQVDILSLNKEKEIHT